MRVEATLIGVVVGDRVSKDELRGARHGVLVLYDEGCLWQDTTFTRRGARRRYRDVLDWLVVHPDSAHARPGDEVELIRVERERVAQRMLIRIPGDASPDAGVREPRRPRPSAGGAAAVADPPDG
jgi:hypothetical protein